MRASDTHDCCWSGLDSLNPLQARLLLKPPPVSYANVGIGGGGGVIHFLAPVVTSGNINVSGGTGGTGLPLSNPQSEPFPGGACGGNGGDSGAVGSPGGAGQVFTTIVSEPAALFVP